MNKLKMMNKFEILEIIEKPGLIVGKQYKHPGLDFLLTYRGSLWFDSPVGFVFLNESNIEKLTEAKEKIKAECDVWIRVRTDVPPDDHVLDKAFGLLTGGRLHIEKPCPSDWYKVVKLKATFEEIDDE
jgi:hypothetical protein